MAVSLIELGRGGRMNMGQIMRMAQKNGKPGILVERVARREPMARRTGRLIASTRFVPSHEGRPGLDRLDRMVGVPTGMSPLERTLPEVEEEAPGPAYYPGEAPRQERVRRQTSPVDLYAMSEDEFSPLVREERRQIGQAELWPYERRFPGNRPRRTPLYECEPGVGQAEEAIVKEERVLPPSRKEGEKVKPAPLPAIAKVGIGVAIVAGITTFLLGIRQVVKEG